MPDREKVINAFVLCRVNEGCSTHCPYWNGNPSVKECTQKLATDVYSLLKEQEAEIRQLRLALDIAKGTCNGIVMEGR